MADENDDGPDFAAEEEAFEDAVEEDENEDDTGGPRETARESRALKFLTTHHPECRLDYAQDVLLKLPLSEYPPNAAKDTKHRSVPYLTLYEKTKIIGFRANQIAQGARPLIEPPAHVTDVLEIARLELEQRRLPFILKRPMPDGSYEYWRLQDLIIL
jgi:DNA-directed RNA polymerase I, II, and III subunit RPABC2